MTYWAFHLVFILPVILILGVIQPSLWRPPRRRHLVWVLLIAVIAIIYTTPWDNYLVYRQVWGYGPDRVLGTIGWVPIEEYLFFLLQPILAGLWLLFVLPRIPAQPSGDTTRSRVWGLTLYLGLAGVGAVSLTQEAGLYLGLILVWAAPVLLLQWAVGSDRLWRSRRTLLVAVVVPTVYLWLCDRIALGLGIWHISPRYTTGLNILGLPIEEAVFFLITNLLIVQGLLLMVRPRESYRATLEYDPATR